MMYMRQIKRLGLLAAISLSVSVAAPAGAEVRQIDGYLWQNSTTAEKQAYLIGISNTLSVYQAVQVKKGAVDANAPLSQYLRATDTQTIRSLQETLDRWYAANPTRLNTPVLGVVWLGVVKARQ